MGQVAKDGLTGVLERWSAGDQQAAQEVMSLLYHELKALARHYLRRERRGHTLEATAVVNEAFARLLEQGNVRWQNRAHFKGFFAHVMRRVLVDYARERKAAKRGGRGQRVELVEAQLATAGRTPDLLALDEALTRLSALDAQKAAVVELRFFGGLSVVETAASLNVSRATVDREWSRARAWLFRELYLAAEARQKQG